MYLYVSLQGKLITVSHSCMIKLEFLPHWKIIEQHRHSIKCVFITRKTTIRKFA